ncbi:MAG: efflux transporter outer membrane subunit [Rhodanobacter sp.]
MRFPFLHQVIRRNASDSRLVAGLLGVLLTALSGCATPLPKLAPPVPVQWQHGGGTAAAKPTDLHGWWQAFGDPQLDALVARALSTNLDVAQAVQRLLAVRTLQRRAQARFLPSVHASTTQMIDPDASASFLVAGFDASWELGLFGKRTGTRREAQGQLDASTADLRSAHVTLVAEVVREWIELRTAQRHEQLLLQVNQARQQQWHAQQIRDRLQLATAGAADQAQAAFAQSTAALAAPRQAITSSAQQLAVLLGQNEPDPTWLQPGPPPELGAWRLASAPADLLRTRPEIAHAEAEVLRAAGELGLARANRYPSVGLGGSLIWSTDLNNNRRNTVNNTISSLGPMVDIPLFDWGMRAAAAHAKDHELQASVLAYRQAVLQGVAEVETALGNLQQQQQREHQDEIAWQALQRTEQTMRTRVRLRVGNPIDQAESEVAAAQAALELADARATRSLAYVALFKALGGAPLPPATPAVTSAAPSPVPETTADEARH